MEISFLKIEDKEKLEEFFVLILGEDFRALARLHLDNAFSNACFKHNFLIGKEKDKIIAAISFGKEMFTVDTWGVSWVAVHPEFQGRGVGQEIVEACLREIAKKITCLSTAILATLEGKTRLYEKTGFSGLTTDHEGGLVMTKTIEPLIAGEI